jgi:hypothetical protein
MTVPILTRYLKKYAVPVVDFSRLFTSLAFGSYWVMVGGGLLKRCGLGIRIRELYFMLVPLRLR